LNIPCFFRFGFGTEHFHIFSTPGGNMAPWQFHRIEKTILHGPQTSKDPTLQRMVSGWVSIRGVRMSHQPKKSNLTFILHWIMIIHWGSWSRGHRETSLFSASTISGMNIDCIPFFKRIEIPSVNLDNLVGGFKHMLLSTLKMRWPSQFQLPYFWDRWLQVLGNGDDRQNWPN